MIGSGTNLASNSDAYMAAGNGPVYTGDNPSLTLAQSLSDMVRYNPPPTNVAPTNGSMDSIHQGHTSIAAQPASSGTPGVLHGGYDGGKGEILPISGYNIRTYIGDRNQHPYPFPYSAVCDIFATFLVNGKLEYSGGSGIIIGLNYVLTAAHVIYDPVYGFAQSITISPAYEESVTFNHVSIMGKDYMSYVTSSLNHFTDYDDYAVIDCNSYASNEEGKAGTSIGANGNYFGVAAPDDTIFEGGYEFYTDGFPAWTYIHSRNPGEDQYGVEMYESTSEDPDAGTTDVMPDIYGPTSTSLIWSQMDVSHGDSGAGLTVVDDDGYETVISIGDGCEDWSNGIDSGISDFYQRITPVRQSIILNAMATDGDEPAYITSDASKIH